MMQLLLWAQSNPFVSFLILLAVVFFMKELLIYLISRHKIIYYFVLFPGVVIHELSHVMACVLTGTKIKRVSLFNSAGGYVEYVKPKLSIASDLIISIFPFVVGILLIFLFVRYNPISGVNSPSMVFYLKYIFATYLILSVILCMLPSFTDFKNASLGYILLIIISVILNGKFFKLGFPFEITKIVFFCAIALVVVDLILVVAKLVKIIK